MGNSPITVGLRTDQNCYSAGSTLTGRVYVSIAKEPQPLQALMLKIVGAEHVIIHHTSSHNDHDGRDRNNSSHSRTEDHYERATATFLQLEYPLHTFPQGQLPPGQYEYPFEIQLPHNLPSSMTCHNGQSNCDVKYKLIATLQKASSGIFSPNPSAQQQVEITSVIPASRAIQQSRHLPAERIPVKKCCCRGKGSMSLEMKVDRTTVQPNDTANVEFRCQNESSVKVERLRVQLTQIIDWSCHGHHKTVRKVLDQQTLHDASEYPELRSRKQRRRRQQYYGVPSSQGEELLPGSWRSSQLRIPSQSNDSYSGRNIQIRHVLSVQLQTKGCCTTNPEASTLIQLHRSVPKTSSYYDNNSNDYPTNDPLASATATVAPSAPPDMFDEQTATPSAPPASYDANNNSSGVPMAEAQALPADWNAQMADVVNIPMAEAIVLEPEVKFS